MSRAGSAKSNSKLILVTGATGYIALNVINLLAKEPHRIRAAVRNLNDKKKIETIQKAANGSKYPIEFVYGDLLKADSWKEACKNVDIVMHVASPYPIETPKDVENELYRPALEGTLNVLKAANEANVSRVVLTSSAAAIYDFNKTNTTFSERDWPDPEKTTPYFKSKIIAERAAWDFLEEKKKNNQRVFELTVINPCAVQGPTFGDGSTLGTSEMHIVSFLKSEPNKQDEYYCGHCDVRDVALAHIKAAFLPEAVGHRHLIASEFNWISNKVAYDILKQEFGSKGFKINVEFNKAANPNNNSDITRMTKVLGIKPTDYRKTVIDMANSLIENGIVKK